LQKSADAASALGGARLRRAVAKRLATMLQRIGDAAADRCRRLAGPALFACVLLVCLFVCLLVRLFVCSFVRLIGWLVACLLAAFSFGCLVARSVCSFCLA
jgi:cobalamin biosynthesis protein CobD/CbiB